MASNTKTSTSRRSTAAKTSAANRSRAATVRSKVEGRRGQATAAVKAHPYATFALGALAAGAGIAAFLLSRRENGLPLDEWGQKVEDLAGKVEKKVKSLRKDGIDLEDDTATEIKTGAIAY